MSEGLRGRGGGVSERIGVSARTGLIVAHW